jgi:nucleoside-diphosphate-sugar epimerase
MVGSFAAREFLANGEEVVLYDLELRPSSLVGLERAEKVQADATDQARLFDVVRSMGSTQIVHTAAALTPMAVADPYRATLINTYATLNVLEATRQFGLQRLVFASSGRVYGRAAQRPTNAGGVSEDTSFNPESAYGTMKIAGEFLGKNYMDAYGISFVALRFSGLYGPSQGYGRLGFRPLQPLLESALKGQAVRVKPFFAGAMEMTYARDAGQSVFLAATAPTVNHLAYNIGAGRAYTFDDLVQAVRTLNPRASIEVERRDEDAAFPMPAYSVMDCSRAAADLGFHAEYDLHAGLRDLVEWLCRMGYPEACLGM